jgi:hypothetical protein
MPLIMLASSSLLVYFGAQVVQVICNTTKPLTKNNAFRLLVVNMVMNFSFKGLIFI